MIVLKYEDIKNIEKLSCKSQGIKEIELVYRAANAFVSHLLKLDLSTSLNIRIYCGNGNNGADGLQIANYLVVAGYEVDVYIINVSDKPTVEFELSKRGLNRSIKCVELKEEDFKNHSTKDADIIIDGLLGAGLSRPVDSKLAVLINKINDSNKYIIAIDIPSGIHCDHGVIGAAVKSNRTIGLGCGKPGYFLDKGVDHIGRLDIVDIGLSDDKITDEQVYGRYIETKDIIDKIIPITPSSHKYKRGHSLLIGGSFGMSGCMRLAGEAALRTGCGLVTLKVPNKCISSLQSSFPEALVIPGEDDYLTSFSTPWIYHAYGIGPGLGCRKDQLDLIKQVVSEIGNLPGVWDADALNLCAMDNDLLHMIPAGSILTPHLGEFNRLFGKFDNTEERIDTLIRKAIELKVVIILKGPHSFIACPDGTMYINSTGNPSMATAGSGDVLAGMITSLLAQGYTSKDAAIIGVYLHGLAGDLAVLKTGNHSLIASDIIKYIGKSYDKIKKPSFI